MRRRDSRAYPCLLCAVSRDIYGRANIGVWPDAPSACSTIAVISNRQKSDYRAASRVAISFHRNSVCGGGHVLRLGLDLFLWLVGRRYSRSLQKPVRTRCCRLADRPGCDTRFFMDNLVRCTAKVQLRYDHAANWISDAAFAHALCHRRLAVASIVEPHFSLNLFCGVQLAHIYPRSRTSNCSRSESFAVFVLEVDSSGRNVRRVAHQWRRIVMPLTFYPRQYWPTVEISPLHSMTSGQNA